MIGNRAYAPSALRPARVPWNGGGDVFDAWIGEDRWNGWLVPFFTQAQASVLATRQAELHASNPDCYPETFLLEAGEWYSLLGGDRRRCSATEIPGPLDSLSLEPGWHLGDGWCWELEETE